VPTAITLYQIGVWFCVGLFTSFGWQIAKWVLTRTLDKL
jgi:hypothetical protein